MTKKLVLFGMIIFSINLVFSQREIKDFNFNWKFSLGNPEKAESPEFNDESWENVRLPHDWAIGREFDSLGSGNTGKLPWKDEGWYRKRFSVKLSGKDHRFYLLFDGVMAQPRVYINGILAGKWDYGYNSFYIDITPFLDYKENNLVAVHVSTLDHQSRWYPGGGIYRNVKLIEVHQVHSSIWGTQITTPKIEKNYATVEVNSQVVNPGKIKRKITIRHEILTADSILVGSTGNETITSSDSIIHLTQTATLYRPVLWDITNPYQYQLRTIVLSDNQPQDVVYQLFGVRTIKFTENDGFYLNDRKIQFQGVNLHHDQGPLGSAFYERSMERQLEIMKSMGCNAIRTSHNPPAPELLDLCDKMGLLVIDEAFDKWNGTADITGETDFDEFADRNIRNFITRDRNHPSIVLWSVGNEIYEVQANKNNEFEQLKKMVAAVHRYDSTRSVTLVCDRQELATTRHFDFYDVNSWNYGRRYQKARELAPDKPVIITESGSTVSTRGFYELPLPIKKTSFTNSLQVSSYDLNAPEWADLPDEDFYWQEQDRFVCGEFVWTGFDYLGEPTPYNDQWVKENNLSMAKSSHSSYFGIVDLVGLPKDRYYLYKSQWLPEINTIHILPHWNWEGMEGEKIPVYVYTNGECADLYLNYDKIGTQCKNYNSDNPTERYRLKFDVPYQPGTLRAEAYLHGKSIGNVQITTASSPQYIELLIDKDTLANTGYDLSYITILTKDEVGIQHPLADSWIDLNLEGPGELIGVGNGNPQCLNPFSATRVQLFNGMAVAIIRAPKGAEGNITVSATSEGLKPATAIISVVH